MGGLIGWGLAGGPRSLRARLAAPFVRRGVTQMAKMFIAGESPTSALSKLISMRKRNLTFTVDLLGEYCVSEKEAQIYLDRYLEALKVFGEKRSRFGNSTIVQDHPADLSPICISVKLSALYSQCSPLNFDRSVSVLSERLSQIVRQAAKLKASLYVDAEDSSNNPIIYTTFKKVFGSEEFKKFPYPGAVVQAYSKHSEAVLEDLKAFSHSRGSPIAIRLVKGAYWDQETMQCKQMNWESPLWEKKNQSDVHFEKLSRFLLDNHRYFLPAFASHNIRSLSHAICYADSLGLSNKDFELQMLYGMAEPIARAFSKRGYLVRLYVPLGNMIVGMGYLVRRLLENTSNESFLKHTFHDSNQVAELLVDPLNAA
jgi:RHH-type proline utilization regulon transcriptional repressor/proline dehydrogenase/delta 1-pyrroline-5-carboxylate dehydrogenase